MRGYLRLTWDRLKLTMIRSASFPLALDRFGSTLWYSQLGKISILPATGLYWILVQQLRGRLASGMYSAGAHQVLGARIDELDSTRSSWVPGRSRRRSRGSRDGYGPGSSCPVD